MDNIKHLYTQKNYEQLLLVCPFCIWPPQGFYVELLLIDAFPSGVAIKMEKGVFLIFPMKDLQLAALLQNFVS